MTVDAILAALRGRCLPLANEKNLQADMADVFKEAGLVLEREVRVGPREIIDFLGAGVGIEVKIKGSSKREIYRQLERYAQSDRIEQLVLVTNVPMGMPPEINGKPVYVHNLALAWL